jgi:hypothetical protein
MGTSATASYPRASLGVERANAPGVLSRAKIMYAAILAAIATFNATPITMAAFLPPFPFVGGEPPAGVGGVYSRAHPMASTIFTRVGSSTESGRRYGPARVRSHHAPLPSPGRVKR